ncbi:hypothetical protein ACM66B_005346 [Microbotryomycetes sp. NB124-2]
MSAGKLYTFPRHSRGQPILVAAELEGVSLDKVDVKMPTDAAFRAKFPLGRIPAFENGDFLLTESVAIATYVAKINNKAGLLGKTKEDEALVLSWASWANMHLLAALSGWIRPLTGLEAYNKAAVETAKTKALGELEYLEKILQNRTFLVAERITLGDLFTAAALVRGFEFVLDAEFRKSHVNVVRYFNTLVNQEAYKAVLGGAAPVQIEEAVKFVPPKKEAKPAAAPKAAEAPKPKPAAAAAADDEEAAPAPKPKHPCEALGSAKSFPLDEWKRQYSNNDTPVAMKWLEEHYDAQDYSLWRADYKYNEELTQVFMSSNLITGFHSRLEGSRKYIFGSSGVYGTNNNNKIAGVYMIRGSDYKQVFDVAPDYESYNFTPLDFKADREFIEGCWSWTNTLDGLEYADGKVMK